MGTIFEAWMTAEDPAEVTHIGYVYQKPDGSQLTPFRCTGGGTPQECGPAGITASADAEPDSFGVMDQIGTYQFLYVYALDREGNESRYLTSGEVQNVAGVSSHSLNVPNLVVESTPGTFLMKWGSNGSGNGQFIDPVGIAINGGNQIYVTDKGNSRVQKFDLSGNFISSWGSIGSGDGQFSDPQGIAVNGGNDVYVVDKQNHRIQRFSGGP
jgi:hypothetical protein